jgi:hypothetical protein
VQLLPDPPISEESSIDPFLKDEGRGAIAQLGERLLCKQEVIGSIPIGSTIFESPNNLQSRVFDDAPEARLLFNNPKVFLI